MRTVEKVVKPLVQWQERQAVLSALARSQVHLQAVQDCPQAGFAYAFDNACFWTVGENSLLHKELAASIEVIC